MWLLFIWKFPRSQGLIGWVHRFMPVMKLLLKSGVYDRNNVTKLTISSIRNTEQGISSAGENQTNKQIGFITPIFSNFQFNLLSSMPFLLSLNRNKLLNSWFWKVFEMQTLGFTGVLSRWRSLFSKLMKWFDSEDPHNARRYLQTVLSPPHVCECSHTCTHIHTTHKTLMKKIFKILKKLQIQEFNSGDEFLF